LGEEANGLPVYPDSNIAKIYCFVHSLALESQYLVRFHA